MGHESMAGAERCIWLTGGYDQWNGDEHWYLMWQ